MTTSTECCERHTSVVCRQEGDRAQHDCDPWPLFQPFRPAVRECRRPLEEDEGRGGGLSEKASSDTYFVLWVGGADLWGGLQILAMKPHPHLACTICQDHKHIRLFMALPLCSSFCCVCSIKCLRTWECERACARTMCTLIEGYHCVQWCVDIVIGANHKHECDNPKCLQKSKIKSSALYSTAPRPVYSPLGKSHLCVGVTGVVVSISR